MDCRPAPGSLLPTLFPKATAGCEGRRQQDTPGRGDPRGGLPCLCPGPSTPPCSGRTGSQLRPSGEHQRPPSGAFLQPCCPRPLPGQGRGNGPSSPLLIPPVVLPPEKAEGPGQPFSVDDGERAANREGLRGLSRKHLHIDALQCDVSVEDNRQEWTFTLYGFDNRGKATREVIHLCLGQTVLGAGAGRTQTPPLLVSMMGRQAEPSRGEERCGWGFKWGDPRQDPGHHWGCLCCFQQSPARPLGVP